MDWNRPKQQLKWMFKLLVNHYSVSDWGSTLTQPPYTTIPNVLVRFDPSSHGVGQKFIYRKRSAAGRSSILINWNELGHFFLGPHPVHSENVSNFMCEFSILHEKEQSRRIERGRNWVIYVKVFTAFAFTHDSYVYRRDETFTFNWEQ